MQTSASRSPGQRRTQGRVFGEPVRDATVDGTCCGHRPILAGPHRVLVGPRGKLAPTTTERGAMCWMCDHPGSTSRTTTTCCTKRFVSRAGRCSTSKATGAPYAYTIGLHDWDVPELLDHRRIPAACHYGCLNIVARDARERRALDTRPADHGARRTTHRDRRNEPPRCAHGLGSGVRRRPRFGHCSWCGPTVGGAGRGPRHSADGRAKQPVLGVRSRVG